jgi:hypothetical protein
MTRNNLFELYHEASELDPDSLRGKSMHQGHIVESLTVERRTRSKGSSVFTLQYRIHARCDCLAQSGHCPLPCCVEDSPGSLSRLSSLLPDSSYLGPLGHDHRHRPVYSSALTSSTALRAALRFSTHFSKSEWMHTENGPPLTPMSSSSPVTLGKTPVVPSFFVTP